MLKKKKLGILLSVMLGVAPCVVGQAAITVNSGATESFADAVAVTDYVQGLNGAGTTPYLDWSYRTGVQVLGASSYAKFNNGLSVDFGTENDVANNNYNGVSVSQNGKLQVKGDLNIKIDATAEFDNYGIRMNNGAMNVTGGKTVIDVGANNGRNNRGIYGKLDGNKITSDVFVDDVDITVAGSKSAVGVEGVRMNVRGDLKIVAKNDGDSWTGGFANSVVNLAKNSDIVLTGDSDYIIGYRSANVTTQEGTTHNITVKVTDGNDDLFQAHGICYGNFNLAKDATLNIDVSAPVNQGHYWKENQTSVNGIVSSGFRSEKGSVTNITVSGFGIDEEGWGGSAGYSFYGKNNVINGDMNINVLSENGVGIKGVSQYGDGDSAEFNGNLKVVTNNGYAILAMDESAGGNTITINKNGGKDVVLVGDIDTRGDKKHVIDITMDTDKSYFTGAAMNTGGNWDTEINLNLAHGAVWNMTGDSRVNELVNNSVVNMLHTRNNDDEVLEIGKLSGNGTFIMNTHLQESYDQKNVMGAGDKIVITEESSGNHKLLIRDASHDTGTPAEGYLLLVRDYSGGTATFTGSTLERGGIFKYSPIITSEEPGDDYEVPTVLSTPGNQNVTNWYLTGYASPVNPDPDPDDGDQGGQGGDGDQGGSVDPVNPVDYLSDNAKSSIDLAHSRYVNYLMDHDTLLKRLGELRMVQQNKDEDNDGIWARFRKGSMTTDTLDGDFKTYQLGYDKEITPGRRYVGAAVSHTDSSYDGSVASAEGNTTALSIYNTWLGEKNHYLDLVAKAGRMHGDSTCNGSLFAEKGSYKTMFYSLSAEYGRKNMNDNGFYYEPQAQLTLGRINGDNYVTSLGNEVQQDAVNSVLGRVGVTFGKEFNMDKPESRSNIYAKVNVLHEFAGDSKVALADSFGERYTASKDYGGTWLNVGVGATANIGKATNLYMDFEKNFGGEVKSNWIGQVGLRVSF